MSVVQRWILTLTAVFALVWAVIRARLQSITLDEADTYFWFVANSEIFYPFPNNHVLNSLLMWMATNAFGLSSLTARAPALLGAALYISACYFLVRMLTDRFLLQFSLFVCLILNPFILDFMVAARGYSLANAFLLVAMAIPVGHVAKGRPSLDATCACASAALGLSFTANFPFAFVDLAVFLAVVIWAIRRRNAESIARVCALCVIPGLTIVFLICGYTLLHMRRGDLFYGAQSLSEMTGSLIEATLYQINPRVGGSLFKVMRFLKPRLLPALGILCVCQLAATWLDGSWHRTRTRWMAAALAGILAMSVTLHWAAFRLDHLPLPKSRTGIFLLPLCTLLAGVIGAGPAQSTISQWLRRGITGVFLCLACYFMVCLRLEYFKEYEYDRDVKDVYAVLARLNHTYGVTDVAATGVYANPLNFYRVASSRETFPEFKAVAGAFPVGRAIYVMHGPFERPFIERERLAIIYRGRSGEVVVAVKPGGPIPAVQVRP